MITIQIRTTAITQQESGWLWEASSHDSANAWMKHPQYMIIPSRFRAHTYCPVPRLGEHVGEEIVTCGLLVEQRVHNQITGDPMKFLTLADWTGMVETELFAVTYWTYGLATVRYPVLEITARVEAFENGRGFSLRAMAARKPRVRRTRITEH